MQTQEEVLMIKGKRSKRPRLASPLSLSPELSGGDVVSPCNSGDEEEEEMANCLILLARGGQVQRSTAAAAAAEAYQCKTCNKSFLSFQALGGHRASHRKPNKPVNVLEEKKPLMMREKQEADQSTILSLQVSNSSSSTRVLLGSCKSSRVHECSICGAEFGSGQALGGHMRRHRPIPAVGVKRPRNILSLDLNLPAPEDHDHTESKFPFSAKEQVIVFSASPLIDCHF